MFFLLKKWFFIVSLCLFTVFIFGNFIYIYSGPLGNENYELPGGLNLGGPIYTQAEGLTVTDIDKVHFFYGVNFSSLNTATETTTPVKFHEPRKVHGFDDIEIEIEGTVGDRFTLVFGVDSLKAEGTVLAGHPFPNRKIAWLELIKATQQTQQEYGEFYLSSDRAVKVTAQKSGIRIFLGGQEFSQVGGFIVEFNLIGRTDLFCVKKFTLLDFQTEKSFKVLFINRAISYDYD